MKIINTNNLILTTSIIFLIVFFSLLIAGSISEKTPKINMGVNRILGEVKVSAPAGSSF